MTSCAVLLTCIHYPAFNDGDKDASRARTQVKTRPSIRLSYQNRAGSACLSHMTTILGCPCLRIVYTTGPTVSRETNAHQALSEHILQPGLEVVMINAITSEAISATAMLGVRCLGCSCSLDATAAVASEHSCVCQGYLNCAPLVSHGQ